MALRVLAIYGTRPEAIEMAPVIAAGGSAIDVLPVVTGQHREMLTQVNDVFGITPLADLAVFESGMGLSTLGARMIAALPEVLHRYNPDAVLVQGDTTTAFAAAVAAYYERLPVFHLEAGLRTGSIDSPFPEEGNRRMISQVTRLHLAPTPAARDNLLATGIEPRDVVVTGNTVIDALHSTLARVDRYTDARLDQLDASRPALLATSHRRESWGEPMRRTAKALAQIAHRRPDLDIVLPLHPNPAVRAIFEPVLAGLPNVLLTDPLAYPDLCLLLNRSTMVLTDSGGIQEEAPALGKPVLVLRDETERPEAVQAGTAILVGTDTDTIVGRVLELMDDPIRYAAMATARNPFGDGHAAARTVAAMRAHFGESTRLADFDPDIISSGASE